MFPYLNPPENYCYGVCSNWKGTVEQKDIKDFDKEYFAVNGKLIPVEGKALKVVIEKTEVRILRLLIVSWWKKLMKSNIRFGWSTG